ncbi:SusC/RagA family TonB-linked outer membrane protein [Arundinibacter roseus]|uniref:TonB-dependent receptor n=1 Tax=Arundinibacter roseus TaxID=2070510 RepID=A0A4R4KIA8_9BACT|nr:TonB-dependent receptor [Arundinibacter roseus]TDB67900.1 TonB-dependent receptor [Arundinibacter roseus]
MKNRVLLFLLVTLVLGYFPRFAQSQVFARNQKSAPLGRSAPTVAKKQLTTILNELKEFYGVDILYFDTVVRNLEATTDQVDTRQKLEKNLDAVLRPHGLRFKKTKSGAYLVITKEEPRQTPREESITNPIREQSSVPTGKEELTNPTESAKTVAPRRLVNGTVRDETGGGLPGVSVVIKGTTRGTTSDSEGAFELDVPNDSDILVFSFVGYKCQEILVGTRSILSVVMVPESKALNEVVVVGYGTQKAKDLTGAVSTINQDLVKDWPVATLDQKMIGQVAGVQITQPSGSPGGGTSIRIRGSGSLGAGNEPLYVVDGMPYSAGLNQNLNPLMLINPNDIESITVLKDASSTAIYGSRGANGVILINTKKGTFNRTQVQFSTMMGVQQVPQKGRPNMMNQRDFADYQRNKIDIAVRRAENRASTLDDYPVEYRNLDQLQGDGTDWYDLLLRDAAIRDYNVSVQKGSEDSRMDFSLGYFKQDGVLKYTGVERYSSKLSMETNLGRAVTAGATIQPTFIKQNRTNTNSNREDVIGVATWANPLTTPYDANGELVPYVRSPQSKYHSAWSFANPLFVLRETSQTQEQFQNLGSAYLQWDILPGLTAKTSLNTIWSTSKFSSFTPSTVGGSNRPPVAGTGMSSNSRAENFNWLIENTITYNKAFGNHRINVLGGYTTQKSTGNSISLNASPYSNDLIETINAAQAISTWDQNVNEWSIISYLGRINYNFQDKYLLTATIRSDGSSRFGANNRYATFPSIAGAWRVSKERFLANSKAISSLKLRASYGTSGNNNIGNYSHLASINANSYVFANNLVTASFVGLSNPFLTWEESSQIDAGIDLELFKSNLLLTVDFYNRKSQNMLLNDIIPAITGFNSQIVNKGNVRNRGLEISLGGSPLVRAVRWDINANIAFNRNTVLSLNDNSDRILSGNNDGNPTHISVVGKPIGQFFGFINDGVYSAADIANPDIVKTPQVYEGNPKYRDTNGDGIVSDLLDYAIIGNPQPNFIFGLSNNFSYKRFTLGVIINGQQGGQVMNGLRQSVDNLQGFFNVRQEWVNRWRSSDNPGDGMLSGVPKLTPSWGHRVNTLWVEDASFLRIANLNFGYSIPETLLKKTGFISSCRIYATVQNLAMFTNYEGANPEAQSRNIDNTLSPGFDMSSYPLSRTSSIGINVSF